MCIFNFYTYWHSIHTIWLFSPSGLHQLSLWFVHQQAYLLYHFLSLCVKTCGLLCQLVDPHKTGVDLREKILRAFSYQWNQHKPRKPSVKAALMLRPAAHSTFYMPCCSHARIPPGSHWLHFHTSSPWPPGFSHLQCIYSVPEAHVGRSVRRERNLWGQHEAGMMRSRTLHPPQRCAPAEVRVHKYCLIPL